jgi:membrane protease YdiL (CAAX protease family)
MLKLLLLIASLAMLWWFVRNDASEYAAFKRQPDTAGRQHFYGIWILKSFLALFGTSMVCLLVLRQLHALLYLPDEFIPLAARLGADMPTTVILDKEILAGCAAGAMLIGILLGVFIAKRLKTTHATLADIEPLMPRNGAETGWAALLSLNAGLSEECFFRLVLPLLLVGVLHNPLLAFISATILFGLVHIYQGVLGVVMTTLVGVVLAGLYLWTGSLWMTIAAHAGLDLFGLVVRPTFMRLLHRPAPTTGTDS